jgi:uncharacterized membrane protein YidH (DUF202 family)
VTTRDDEGGLAAERTALAWLRTSLAYAATGAVALRVVPGTTSRSLVAGALLLAAVVAAWAGTGIDGGSGRRRPRVLLVAAVTTLAATMGVVSAVVGPGAS